MGVVNTPGRTGHRIRVREGARIVIFLLAIVSPAIVADLSGRRRARNALSLLVAQGLSYADLATGEELLVRADESFHVASAMKAAVMLEAFREPVKRRALRSSRSSSALIRSTRRRCRADSACVRR